MLSSMRFRKQALSERNFDEKKILAYYDKT